MHKGERISSRGSNFFYTIHRTRPHKIINTGDYLLFMLRVREIVEELKVFERNKVPFDVKVLGV
ncbi:MAG: hypothetical protein ACXQTL_00460, partial [Methanosarcinales archaeon]